MLMNLKKDIGLANRDKKSRLELISQILKSFRNQKHERRENGVYLKGEFVARIDVGGCIIDNERNVLAVKCDNEIYRTNTYSKSSKELSTGKGFVIDSDKVYRLESKPCAYIDDKGMICLPNGKKVGTVKCVDKKIHNRI